MSIAKMKMLQRMRLLEERGQTFANTPIKELQVFGESSMLRGGARRGTLTDCWVLL